MEDKTNQIICSLCQSVDATFFTEKKGFKIYKCSKCKLLFIFPLPASIDVYDKAYFSGADNGFGYVDYDVDKEAMVPTFNKYFDIFKKFGKKDGKLLDIGSATGFFMELARFKGFQVSGIEISDFAAEKGRKKGLSITTGDIFTPNFASENFDVITMFDVIEHVPNPKETISEARRILKKGGILVINTPDAESFWAKILGANWQLIMPPEHINYFSPKNLGDYLSKNGFNVLLSTKIGKSFTIQYILKMLYKWQGSKIFLTNLFSRGFLSKIHIPINLRDNFFMIVQKKD
ncbi:MAG: Alternative oxidase/tellurite resistance protein TehB [Parcubacteria bacterium C7867-003]|nr:MAG: Alternative oxidase/tellurite resistance protein TehB [Parcubacteria bacterium C7867-003]